MDFGDFSWQPARNPLLTVRAVAINEMVRRLITAVSLVDLVGGFEEDHRHAHTFCWYRFGQNHLSLRGARRRRQGSCAEEVHPATTAGLHSEHANIADRLGSLLWSALPRACLAEAIAEAVERKNMRFVPIKTDDQLDLQALHRVRERLVSRRTAMINQTRAFLLERGVTFRKGPANLRKQMPEILENADENLSPRMRNLLDLLWQEWKILEQQIEGLSTEIETLSNTDPACRRLRQIPGIGPLAATAVVAAIGNGAAFHKGREFAAWLGLVPRQCSTGGKTKLLGISKRGNPYLRKMLIHGARAAVLRLKRDQSPIGEWMNRLEARASKNVLIVATANKLARTVWAVLASGEDYRALSSSVAA